MSKVWGVEVTVALRGPEERVVSPFSVVVMEVSGFSGREAEGKRSKCGPLFRAPCQWVVSIERMPGETASISYWIVSWCY